MLSRRVRQATGYVYRAYFYFQPREGFWLCYPLSTASDGQRGIHSTDLISSDCLRLMQLDVAFVTPPKVTKVQQHSRQGLRTRRCVSWNLLLPSHVPDHDRAAQVSGSIFSDDHQAQALRDMQDSSAPLRAPIGVAAVPCWTETHATPIWSSSSIRQSARSTDCQWSNGSAGYVATCLLQPSCSLRSSQTS